MKFLILFVINIAMNIYYLTFPVELKRSSEILYGITTYQDAFSAWFFGGNFMLLGIMMLIPIDSSLDKQYRKIQGIFTLLTGTMYVFNYLNIYQTNYSQRMWIMLIYLMLATLMILISALRHGTYKD